VSETTWAAVAGASTADAALEFTRAVTFVDEATWRERYQVAEPDYGTKEEATHAPRPTIPDPTEMIIGHRTAPPDEPIPTPVGCPKRLPTENPVPSPIAATEPSMALTAFLAGPNGSFLLKLGYEEVAISSDRYRYDVRNNSGDLVTVVFVDSINGKWAANPLALKSLLVDFVGDNVPVVSVEVEVSYLDRAIGEEHSNKDESAKERVDDDVATDSRNQVVRHRVEGPKREQCSRQRSAGKVVLRRRTSGAARFSEVRRCLLEDPLGDGDFAIHAGSKP
jgi:hypothetical protein